MINFYEGYFMFFNDANNDLKFHFVSMADFISVESIDVKRDICVPRNFSPQTTAICLVFCPTSLTKKQATFNPLLPGAID